MSTGILKTQGTQILDAEGNAVLLRGTTLGGWMLMENFINGFPGRESRLSFPPRTWQHWGEGEPFFVTFGEVGYLRADNAVGRNRLQ
ncbi:hypothetical protein BDW59DRAFT_165608 [Aspergillus cavernicola]|uniref:Uncharacterized protein n=1 Tax=Aspergillus cavernicola TaxID=176166 RepID=A0ABR4HRR2_9EURO